MIGQPIAKKTESANTTVLLILVGLAILVVLETCCIVFTCFFKKRKQDGINKVDFVDAPYDRKQFFSETQDDAERPVSQQVRFDAGGLDHQGHRDNYATEQSPRSEHFESRKTNARKELGEIDTIQLDEQPRSQLKQNKQ